MKVLDKNKHLERPKTILFDWDGTLVNSLGLICDAMQGAFKVFKQLPISKKEFMKTIHGPSEEFIGKHFPNNSHDEVKKVFLDLYKQFANKKLVLLPNAKKNLDYLYKKEIKMAVVSNKEAPLLMLEIKKLGLEKYFLSIVGSGDVKESKPSPLSAFKALKDIGVRPSQEVWFVGDSATDMATAHNSNCLPVFFGADDYTSEHYKSCPPKVHFLNHRDLLKYLSSDD